MFKQTVQQQAYDREMGHDGSRAAKLAGTLYHAILSAVKAAAASVATGMRIFVTTAEEVGIRRT